MIHTLLFALLSETRVLPISSQILSRITLSRYERSVESYVGGFKTLHLLIIRHHVWKMMPF